METAATPRERAAAAGVFAAAVFLPVLVLSSVLVGREISRLYALAWSLFAAGTAFAISYTGKVSFYRRIFFSVSALAFLAHFKFSLFSASFEASSFKQAPFCHIAMAPYFLDYLYQQYLAFMSGGWKLWGPLTLGAAWLFVTLAIGRGWCSWACFYGGIDDALSAAARRPMLKVGNWIFNVRDLPAALLVFMLLASLAYMLPVYCLWLCPFKLGESFFDGDAGLRRIQYGLMAFALAALVIGPLLTKKRIFCSFLCPFAAWQAFWGRLNPFRVTVSCDCGGCMKCAAGCPMSAIKCVPGGKAEILAYCNLCGQCLDACPQGGLAYTLFGSSMPRAGGGLAARLFTAESFFVFSALTLGSVFSSLWAPAALRDIIKLMAP